MTTGRAAPPPEWLREEARRLYGRDPVGYEAGRPEYPERVYDVLTNRCGFAPGATVLEIGPGTGRVTRWLLALGARVVAVEPDASLVHHLSETFAHDSLEVIADSFEDASIPDDAFDLAVAATSFHWIDQDVGLPKLGRVIRRGGWVALWWTIFGDATRLDPFHEATHALLGEGTGPTSQPDRPQFELDLDERQRDLESGAGLVGAQGELIRWTARLDSDQVRTLYGSMIRLLRRPPSELRSLLDTLVAIAEEDFGGVVERPFVTALYTAQRP